MPLDAAYSSGLDRIVLISANPNQIHLYNPVSNTDETITLATPPLALSLSPDGLFAAIGHSNLISYVDLVNKSAVKTIPVSLNVSALILANQYVYILPSMSVRISDGAITNPLAPNATTIRGQLGPDGAIYSVEPPNLYQRNPQGAVIGAPRLMMTESYSTAFGVLNGRVYNGFGKAQPLGATTFSTKLSTPEFAAYKAWASHSTRGLAGITSQIAIVDQVYQDSSIVDLFSPDFPPVYQGRFTLPGRWEGDWIFFSNSGVLYVVNHSGSAYAVYSTALPPSNACRPVANASATFYSWDGSTSIGTGPVTTPGAGGYFAISISSIQDCLYEAISGADWVVPRGRYGGGVEPLVALVRPNPGAAARTTAITLGALTITVNQAGANSAASSINSLGYRTRQAVYSKAPDRFVFTSAFPNELHIYDPVSRASEFQPLPFFPTSLVLSPDGLTAGVGGEGVAMFFNLRTRAATRVFETSLDGQLGLLTPDGFGHFLAPGLPSIDVRTGAIQAGTEATRAAAAAGFLVPPSNRYAYLTVSNNLTEIGKWDLTTPGKAKLVGPPADLGVPTCGPLWYSEDGARMYDCRGATYSISGAASLDLTRNGSLSGFVPGSISVPRVTWLADSALRKTLAASTGSRLVVFGEGGGNQLGQQTLPLSSNSVPLFSDYVAWNSTADQLNSVLRLTTFLGGDSTFPSAIYNIAAGSACATPVVGVTSIWAFGGTGQLAVSATCAWKATSNVAWLSITSGGFGFGSSTVTYSAAGNDTGVARAGTISFGDRTFLLRQSAVGSIAIAPASAAVGAVGGAFSIAVNASPAGVTWTAVSNAAWLRVTSGATGTGQGVVTYSVAPNPSTSSRTGSIIIGGKDFAVSQSAAGGAVTIERPPQTVRAGGETIDVQITAAGSWLAVPTEDWIHIVSPAGSVGYGSAPLRVFVEPNYLSADGSSLSRNGSVMINGQTLSIAQSFSRFRFTLTTLTLTRNPGTGSLGVQTSPGSLWTASSDASWLQVTGSGPGSGSIAYTNAANTTNASRIATIYINDVGSGYYIPVTQAGAPAGLLFVPTTPCRLADTREPSRGPVFGAPGLAAGLTERSFPIPQSACGIPGSAKAYALNVTAVPRGRLGFLSIWPSGEARPFVSTLNSLDGRNKANAAIVAAGSGGAISIAATEATDLVLDISGYFTEASAAGAPPGLAFYPLSPCRVTDTRNGPAAAPLAATVARNFAIRGAAPCGVPAWAQAYSLNVTAVPSASLGFLTIWPAGQAQPLASTLNAPTGAITANAAVVPAGAGGEVTLSSTGPAHVAIDINGYFAPPGAAPNGQRFYPVTPCRAADTREAAAGPMLTPGTSRSFSFAGSPCSLPSTASAYSLNATVVPQPSLGYLTLWPFGQSQPLASTLNAADGAIAANAAIVRAGTGGLVSAYASEASHLILDVNGYFAP